MRKGRLTIEDMEFIEANWKKLSYRELANSLNKSMVSIKKYVETKCKHNDTLTARNIQVEFDLKSRPFWVDIQAQFSESELNLFEYHWNKIISQFKDDVFPTEELQIIEFIKNELLSNRVLRQKTEAEAKIGQLEQILLDEQKKPREERDLDFVNSISNQLHGLRQSQSSCYREYETFCNRKAAMLKDMKATREARIKKLEDSRKTFLGFLNDMLTNKDKRREWGVYLEKMRLAAKIEKQRLAEFHTYLDGQVDQPLFSSDTVVVNDEA